MSDGCVPQCIESLAKEYDEVLCKALDKLAPKQTRTIVILSLQVRKEPLGELTMEDFECTSCFSEFAMAANENVLGLIRASIKACALDPLPVSIMWKCYSSLVPVFRRAINLSLSSGVLPKELKIVLLLPLLKKVNADFEQFSNFCPVSN